MQVVPCAPSWMAGQGRRSTVQWPTLGASGLHCVVWTTFWTLVLGGTEEQPPCSSSSIQGPPGQSTGATDGPRASQEMCVCVCVTQFEGRWA